MVDVQIYLHLYLKGGDPDEAEMETTIRELQIADQQENHRRELEQSRIAQLSGQTKTKAQEEEDAHIMEYEEYRSQIEEARHLTSRLALQARSAELQDDDILPGTGRALRMSRLENEFPGAGPTAKRTETPISRATSEIPRAVSPPIFPTSPNETWFWTPWSPSAVPRNSTPTHTGTYACTYINCNAPPFQSQYLLNAHMTVHSTARPHHCPVRDCPRSQGGKGFKRKNEMIRHGLRHDSPGYTCPFCPDREHRYPRPDNLQRYNQRTLHDMTSN